MPAYCVCNAIMDNCCQQNAGESTMDKNQPELTRLMEVFKAKVRELGVDVDMADNQDLQFDYPEHRKNPRATKSWV